jgi:hypothetical protein
LISGPVQPGVGRENAYSISAVPGATGYEWRAAFRGTVGLVDGAESGTGNFDLETTPGYAVWIGSPVASGSRAFNLHHPAPPEPQLMTLKTNFLVRTNSVLTFRSRLSWATTDEYARVQISTNGEDWQDVYTQAGINDEGETSFSLRTVPLGSAADTVAQLRFNYDFDSGAYYPPTAPGDGWVIDNIVLTNIQSFILVESNVVTTAQFSFNPSLPGIYSLQARPLFYDEFSLDWGPVLEVQATTNLPPVILLGTPMISGSEVILDFTVAGFAASFQLLETAALDLPWSTNSSATLSTNTPGASYRFTSEAAPAGRFYRVQTP